MVGTRVYVGKLPYRARERDVEKFFKGYGKIREIILKNGFGFVEFDDNRDAEDAAYDLNGKELCGERVLIELARGMPRGSDRARWGPPPPPRRRGDRFGPPTRTDYRIRIENLSSRISWQDLKDMFRAVGDVSYADAHTAKKHEGVVEFSNKSDMKKALEKFDGYEVKGRKLKLSREEKRKSRSHSKSKSRSRSRSRSRSGKRSRSSRKTKSRSGSRKSRSGSGSPAADDKDKKVELTDGKEKSKSRERSRSGSRKRKSAASRSKSRSKSHSKSRSKSKSQSKSRSASPEDAHSDTETKQNGVEMKEEKKEVDENKSPTAATMEDD